MELSRKLIGRPEIVIVDKGEPRAARCSGAAVSRRTHSARGVIPNDAYSAVIESGDESRGPVCRCFIDNNHLEVDVPLLQHTRECQLE